MKKAKIELRRSDLRNAMQVVTSVKELPGKQLSIAVLHNLPILRDELVEFNNLVVSKQTEASVTYQQESQKTLQKHAKLDQGKIVREPQTGRIVVANIDNYNEAVLALQESHKEGFSDFQNLEAFSNKLSAERIPLTLMTVPMTEVTDQINGYQLDDLAFMISDWDDATDGLPNHYNDTKD